MDAIEDNHVYGEGCFSRVEPFFMVLSTYVDFIQRKKVIICFEEVIVGSFSIFLLSLYDGLFVRGNEF